MINILIWILIKYYTLYFVFRASYVKGVICNDNPNRYVKKNLNHLYQNLCCPSSYVKIRSSLPVVLLCNHKRELSGTESNTI